MAKRKWVAIIVLSVATGLRAQTAQPAQTETQGQVSSASVGTEAGDAPVTLTEARAPVPLPLNIDAGSLEFSPELGRTNFIAGGMSVGASYDDNLLSSSTTPVGGFIYNVLPHISLNLSRPRLLWSLAYGGGFTVNQRFSAYNQGSHHADFDLRYRLSPHVNVRLRNSYSISTGFFDQLQGNSLAGSSTGLVQQPNLTVITPLARHNDENGSAEITYQFSASDMVGASGTFYDSRFRNVPAGAGALVDTRTEEGDGFYSHRFSARNWSGIAYKFQHLTFNPAIEQVDTHSILLFHTIYLKPRMALSFFAGPEYSNLNTQIVSTVVSVPLITVVSVPSTRQTWSGSGGASFSWQGEHTSISFGGARKVSDGGGLLSAVEITSVSGAMRRQVSPSATVGFGLIYGNDRQLSNISAASKLKSASGSVSWEQHIGRSISANFGYGRDFQQQSGKTLAAADANHNRGWITLDYNFTHPLGR
jgi:hypothetical protein